MTPQTPPGARPRFGHANIHAEISVRLTCRIEEDTPDDKREDGALNRRTLASEEWDERFEALVRDHLPFLPGGEALKPDLDLRKFGLNSLGCVELLVALESTYGVRLGEETMSMRTFATPAALWATLRGKDSPTDLSAR